MSVSVCVCAVRSLQEVAHLSVRLYFLFSLVVSCCRAGHVCGRHLRPVNNTKGMKEGFNLAFGELRSPLRGSGSVAPPSRHFSHDQVNWGGGKQISEFGCFFFSNIKYRGLLCLYL